MHANSVRAGYLDLDGCTVVDMLPRSDGRALASSWLILLVAISFPLVRRAPPTFLSRGWCRFVVNLPWRRAESAMVG